MKYSEQVALERDLREFADFVRDKGLEIPSLTVYARAHVYGYNPKTYQDEPGRVRIIMRRAAKAMGHAKKNHQGSYFDLVRNFGTVKLEITTSRKNVCERIVTGTVHHEEKVLPARTEEIVEWICGDPLLAGE